MDNFRCHFFEPDMPYSAQTPHPRSNLLLFVMSRVRIRSIERRGTFVLFSKDPRQQKDKYERMEANHFVVDFPPGKKDDCNDVKTTLF